jgi:glucose-6-phosphate-specific signal transduction histidine kinase
VTITSAAPAATWSSPRCVSSTDSDGATDHALETSIHVARAAEVTLYGDDRCAEIAVSDDGVGGARTEEGSGLRGLCDRVEALGGRLTLTSASGHGTTVRARVPIASEGRDPISQLV